MRRLACLVVAVLVFIPVFALADSNTDLLEGINQYRLANHLNTVKEDPYTCTVATLRAIQITTDFSHTGFYPTIKSSWVPRGVWYENLAQQFSPDFNVLKGWKESPTHNANLLAKETYGCVRHVGNFWAFEAFHE